MDSTTIARDQLKAIVERVERLHEERDALSGDVRDVYAEAKANGFDVKTIRKVVALRRLDAGVRAEAEQLLDLYLHALGMALDPTEVRQGRKGEADGAAHAAA